jgi:hypothetical protein
MRVEKAKERESVCVRARGNFLLNDQRGFLLENHSESQTHSTHIENRKGDRERAAREKKENLTVGRQSGAEGN